MKIKSFQKKSMVKLLLPPSFYLSCLWKATRSIPRGHSAMISDALCRWNSICMSLDPRSRKRYGRDAARTVSTRHGSFITG